MNGDRTEIKAKIGKCGKNNCSEPPLSKHFYNNFGHIDKGKLYSKFYFDNINLAILIN